MFGHSFAAQICGDHPSGAGETSPEPPYPRGCLSVLSNQENPIIAAIPYSSSSERRRR